MHHGHAQPRGDTLCRMHGAPTSLRGLLPARGAHSSPGSGMAREASAGSHGAAGLLS